jgi:photosystem II stability/assembly factor-like uncharacterized protein
MKKNTPLFSRLYLLLPVFFTTFTQLAAQKPQVEMLTEGTPAGIRGLSVVNDNVVWVSGSNGTVGRSSNGGKTWKWMTVTGFEKTDFRDIEAFDGATAIIMGIGEPAYILKTTNGGDTWKVVYENKTSGMFLDAMEFWNEKSGIVIGDPIDGRFFIARTFDGGDSWQDIPFSNRPVADNGEACFAASGTNVRALTLSEAVFVSGGMLSRIFTKNGAQKLPLVQGKETTGANSIAVWNHVSRKGSKNIIVVGGDFLSDTSVSGNCTYSTDGGKTWKEPKIPPNGYRSCVEFLSKKIAITCGLTGIDITYDAGKNWESISREGFHVVRIAKSGSAVYLAGSQGRVAKLVWEK